MLASKLKAKTHQVRVAVEIKEPEALTTETLTVVYCTESTAAQAGIGKALTPNPDSKSDDDKYLIDVPLWLSACVLEIRELTGDDGQPFTLNKEFWQGISAEFALQIYKAIQTDIAPDPMKAAS